MGLGTFLLNGDSAIARLRAQPPQVAAPAPPPAPVAAEAVRDFAPAGAGEAAPADFVILWPALGCPGLVHPAGRTLDVIFLCQAEETAVTLETVQALARQIQVVPWDTARRPYITDHSPWQPSGPTLDRVTTSANTVIRTKRSLSVYRDEAKTDPQQYGELFHNIAAIVPEVYLEQGFKSIVSARLSLTLGATLQAGQMYTLYYAPENGLLRKVLDSSPKLKKPYDDVPLIKEGDTVRLGGSNQVYQGRAGTLPREHEVRLLHPFWVAQNWQQDYLNVGHVTDVHTSTLWDFFDKKVFPTFPQDGPLVSAGRDPRANADSRFEDVARRYNNPNLNMRSLTQQLNGRQASLAGQSINLASGGRDADLAQFVDLILMTGDLVDFNRGFNHNAAHDPDKDYVFNLNWLRFYELLLLDYQRPIFTSLGNHDRRLNPYPPRIKPPGSYWLVLLYAALAIATAAGTTGGLVGALEGSDSDSAGIKALELLVVPFAVPVVLFGFISLLGGVGLDLDITFDVLFSPMGLKLLLGVGWALGFLIVGLQLLLNALRSDKIDTVGEGFLYGVGLWGGIAALAFFALGLFVLFKERDYMTHITNLFGEDLVALLDNKNVAYLNGFGKDGVLYMTEAAYDWYALVINPFEDYAFRYGNMVFMMADWGGSEILVGDPPVSDDEFTDRQWKLVNHWITWSVEQRKDLNGRSLTAAQKQVVPIIGLHTPVFCPMLDKSLDSLHTSPTSIGDGDLARGTMDEHRHQLIETLYKLGQGTFPGLPEYVPAISLTGHTHTYDIFRHSTADKVQWYQSADFNASDVAAWNRGLHITTACSGPPADSVGPEGGDAKQRDARQQAKLVLPVFDQVHDNSYEVRGQETYYKPGDRVLRPAGARVLVFDRLSGTIRAIEEVSAQTAKWGDA